MAVRAYAPVARTGPQPKLEVTRDVLGIIRGQLHAVSAFVVLAAIVVEAVLVYRLWAQLTDKSNLEGLEGRLFRLGGDLAKPFQSFEAAQPIKVTGIVDMSTLVAIEVYLVAAIATLAVLFLVGLSLGIYSHKRRNRFERRLMGTPAHLR